MDRVAAQSVVTAPPEKARMKKAGIAVEPAGPDDDAAIRALLRGQPMGGEVLLSLEREPDARLAAEIEGDRHHLFVARETGTGSVLGVCSRAVRTVWVNGEARRIGYLGQLRRDPRLSQRLRVFADGFAACDATRQPDELPYDVTSIVADNAQARGFLERASRRFRRLPTYRPFCEFVTLMIPVSRRTARRGAPPRPAPPSTAAVAECLERNGRRHQFAPVWTPADLESDARCRGLRAEDFFVRRDGERVTACLARWDQNAFKQAVVRGYSGRLRRFRWLINAACAVTGHPGLPRLGRPINFAYLSHVMVDGDDGEVLAELVDEARRHSDGQDYLLIGFAATNPMLPVLQQRFGARSYRSVIYLVHRSGAEAEIERLDRRTPHLEVATL